MYRREKYDCKQDSQGSQCEECLKGACQISCLWCVRLYACFVKILLFTGDTLVNDCSDLSF